MVSHVHRLRENLSGQPCDMLPRVQSLACKCCQRSKLSLRRFSTALHRFGSMTHYTILGIKPDATLEEIKTAFLKQSKKLHPDIDLSNPNLHTQFVRLNEAYSVLSKHSSRMEYDAKLRLQQHAEPFKSQARSSSKDNPFYYHVNPTSSYGFNKSEQQQYWEQFWYPTKEDAAFHGANKHKMNLKMSGYCIFILLAGVFIHYAGFRKLEEAHNNFMDHKDRVITEIYNESKERARTNGFKKQQEILRQKHADFMEKYRMKK
ncbi:dnaJ homolog subfamily C member 4 isoform X3 [Narcine bancroftii]|uniref:dnaJ homolog subfamily C member 4 isoform X3 n=1 Tax=Narcine bancroftii TaxID=1343680 RepID=UPI003831F908